jgi:hypothetical protein
MDPRGPAVSEFLLHPVAGERKPGLIEKGAKFIGAGHPDQHRSRVCHDAKAFFTLTLSCCRLSPRQNVGKNVSGLTK